MNDILERAIGLVETDDTRYKGPLIKEDQESLLVKSKYGDVIILKEVHSMQRCHGGNTLKLNLKNF